MTEPPPAGPGEPAPREPRVRRRMLALIVGAVLTIFVAVQVAGGNDVIDLPGWANIGGVDVPLIGDTDTLDCRLSSVPDAPLVEVRVVDGDRDTYSDYTIVWRNGQILDAGVVQRLADDLFVVPGEKGVEQFYAISTRPDPDDRTFCESIVPD